MTRAKPGATAPAATRRRAHKAPDHDYRVEEQVGHLLRRAHQRATAIFLERIGAHNLTPTQFAALVKLRDEGALSQNHLGRLTAMDPATIQGVIRRLKARRLIAQGFDARDRRRSVLKLTRGGRALADRLVPNGFAVSAAILAPLSAAERRRFLALLQRLT
jgi:DNA-binding MarR family transcriptional regulator